jgi:hypothetical protein
MPYSKYHHPQTPNRKQIPSRPPELIPLRPCFAGDLCKGRRQKMQEASNGILLLKIRGGGTSGARPWAVLDHLWAVSDLLVSGQGEEKRRKATRCCATRQPRKTGGIQAPCLQGCTTHGRLHPCKFPDLSLIFRRRILSRFSDPLGWAFFLALLFAGPRLRGATRRYPGWICLPRHQVATNRSSLLRPRLQWQDPRKSSAGSSPPGDILVLTSACFCLGGTAEQTPFQVVLKSRVEKGFGRCLLPYRYCSKMFLFQVNGVYFWYLRLRQSLVLVIHPYMNVCYRY